MLNTARLRRNANEYLKVNQTKRPAAAPMASASSTQPHLDEAGGGEPESLDSQPRTFIVSRDSALPALPSDEVDQFNRANCTVDTSVTVATEAGVQNSHNEEPRAVNNRWQASPHNVEYVSDVRSPDSEASDPIVTPSSLLPEAHPIRGAGGKRDAEQSDLEVCQGSIPKVSMQLQNNNPKIPEEKICNLKASDTELHIADVELHIDEAGDTDGRSEEGKTRPLEPIYESLATASESRVIAQAVGGTTEQAPPSGSPLRGQQPGQSSAGQRRYWPEDELCSPLSRQQRQAASKGLSLPAGRATTSLFDKSLSLGGYYQNGGGDSHPGKLGYLKSSGRRLLQRLSSVRRSLRPKAELPPPLPPDPSDEDRVFFRGFSAVSKGAYGVHSADLVTSNETLRTLITAFSHVMYATGVYSPTAPPRKRRLRGVRSTWDTSSLVGRSFSFNDAERIAAAVERGEGLLPYFGQIVVATQIR